MKSPDSADNDKSERQVTIVFYPARKKCVVAAETSLIKAAAAAGITLDGVCGHKGSCGHCKVKILSGSVTAGSETERDFFSAEQLADGWVLACRRKVLSDIKVFVETEISNTTAADAKPLSDSEVQIRIEPDPWIRKEFVKLPPPSLEDQLPDMERLVAALEAETEAVETELLKDLSITLRCADFRVTAAIFNRKVVSVEPDDTCAKQYGIALDIGTTTVAGYIADLKTGKLSGSASANNKQAAFGADVISRINAVRETENGLHRLQEAVVDTINQIVSELLEMAHIPAKYVYLMTAVGNTTMIHLLLGVTPGNIARAPFIPAFGGDLMVNAHDLGIDMPGQTKLLVLPNVAGYVGSDTVAVALATATDQLPGTWLTVDIGTNGEIVLASESRLLVCSTAAGPAFEGGGIKCGMRATDGAISKLSIDHDIHFSVIGAGKPAGLCGSGVVDAVSEMVRVGLLRNNGWIKAPDECPKELSRSITDRIIIDGNSRRFVLVEDETEIAIYQKDIRNLQLAKGAIRAGIEVLCKKMGIAANELDGILLAGAFGNNLRVESLLGIGMLPAVDNAKIKFVGHAAGLGAYMALISRCEMEKSRNIAATMEHLELSGDPDFQDFFAQSVNFHPNRMSD